MRCDNAADGSVCTAWRASGARRRNAHQHDGDKRPALSRVAVNASGALVVAWQSFGQPGGSGTDIYAQRYDASGNPVGSEFRVNRETMDEQYAPAVAIATDGRFIITWTSNGQDGDGAGVYARRYDNTGAPVNNVLNPTTTTAGDQQASCVGIAADGRFVVAWLDISAGHAGIYFQRYNFTTGRLSSETKVNGDTVSNGAPSIAVDSNFNFTVAWDAQSAGGGTHGFSRSVTTPAAA